MKELLGHGKELGFYPKYYGNSLNGITELVKSLNNQSGCCRKSISAKINTGER